MGRAVCTGVGVKTMRGAASGTAGLNGVGVASTAGGVRTSSTCAAASYEYCTPSDRRIGAIGTYVLWKCDGYGCRIGICAKRSPRRTISTPPLYSMPAAMLVTNGSNGAMMRPRSIYGALYERSAVPSSSIAGTAAASGNITG